MMTRKTILITTMIVIGGLAVAPTAQASTSCGYTLFEQPFLNFNDSGDYVLAPGGSFESGASGWKLAGGAAVQSGGNPLRPTSSNFALSLPVGSSATSAPICVETDYPYSRLFGYTTVQNPSYTSSLKVELTYTATSGKVVTRTAPTLANEPAWDATIRFATQADAIKPDSSGRLWLRYRFTPLYKTAWKIDDLYVDPKRR